MASACLLADGSLDASQPVAEVNPLVGTRGHGHTYPGATTPFGFVQLSPDTRTTGWDACSGYHYSDSTIMGFSHTHISGTGCPELAELLVLPLNGSLGNSTNYTPLNCDRFQSHFSHDNELAQPGYYHVLLDKYNVLAELTATEHAGMHRYTFPASDRSHLLIDLEHAIGNRSIEASMKIEGHHMVTGHRRSTGWAKDKVTYFVIECSQPFSHFGLEPEGKPLADDQTEAAGKSIRCHLDYSTSAGQQIVLHVGLAPTSVEEAKKNLRMEIPTWDFDAVRQTSQNKWNENLSRFKIESSNPHIRQTFYSAMYHTMMAPTLYNDAGGSYRGTDQKVHAGEGFQNYCTFSLWDTFRAEHPLLTLMQPDRVNDFIQSMLVFDKQSQNHLLPLWPLASCETDCMIGYHAVSVIYDAYEKGFRGFDTDFAYQAMRDTAMSDRNRQGEYKKLHWQTTAPRCVTFGRDFPNETRGQSEIEFKDF
jgi:predicted alpha-1,2-mannosidase